MATPFRSLTLGHNALAKPMPELSESKATLISHGPEDPLTHAIPHLIAAP